MGISAQNRVVAGQGQTEALKTNWWPALWVTLLFLASYAVVLGRLAKQWLTDSDMSHGIFVPMLVAYIVWEKRHELAGAKPTHNVFGLLLMLIGAALLCVGPPTLDTFVSVTRVSFLLSLAGTLLYLRGFPSVRILLYPLLLILLMIPMPGFVIERVTFPLQIVASNLAEHILEIFGYSVLREGNILRLPDQTLNVAEACSGLRSVVALTFLGQSYAYLFDSRPWMRALIAVIVIPIAIFANSLRIVASAIAGSHNPLWGQGVYHESTGWVVFVVAFVCILCSHLLIKRIWPERKTA
jgi:exosortase